ncbi:hypothetical protein D0867_09109 [Hortaea werneckii]|uniref:MI domain-containing protein n=1 Tax=Hortaea werneckii TaxID=91943 RepID=A0A3M7ALX0_HORWE|nr:hypothetical protein D0867_09109 [Hortaea werneckii]RMY28329.1 hypothetical protein D0866_09497 [Hortaea werneckii]
MSRNNGYGGPKLPKFLLDQVGGGQRVNKQASRKDRRKAERDEKKAARSRPAQRLDRASQRAQVDESDGGDEEFGDEDEATPPPQRPAKDAKPAKSILKAPKSKKPEPEPGPETEPESETGDELEEQDDGEDLLGDDDDDDDDEEDEGAKSDDSFTISRQAAKAGLGDEEDEIAALERKLGMKGKKRSYDFGDDELDWLVTGSDSEDGGRAADASAPPPKRVRENPYVAPVAKEAAPSAGKYVPPSLRKPASSDDEALRQLRRQIQGQLNRLSEANMLSILAAIEGIYTNNARQHVTSTLVDLLVGLVSDSAVLNDTFIILHAGFSAALYKVVGTDFGAQLLEKIVESFDAYRADNDSEGKQPLNLMAFLSSLYAFQVVGCGIIFDYIRLLLDTMSESNTELLLRIIRSSGTQLRADDPTALKDIVLLLQRNIAAVGGEANVSVRTKFMIETINNLKNNRMKPGAAATSAVTAEHTTRMRKTLGSLNTRSTLRANEPLRITRADIKDSEKKGKWWLVGASYHDPAKLASSTNNPSGTQSAAKVTTANAMEDDGYESETPGNNVNLTRLARQQGMNTDIRRAIFIALLSAADYKDAHMRLLKLKLKSKQFLSEVPRVLVHCAGAEAVYNPYYTLIAKEVCLQGPRKGMMKHFLFAAWDVLRRLGGDGEEDEEDESEKVGTKKIVNLGKMYGTLIAEGVLGLGGVLKTVKGEFTYLAPKTSLFVEVLLTTILLQLRKKTRKDEEGFASKVRDVFLQTGQVSAGLVQGLQFFVRSSLSRAALANGKKEERTLKEGCDVASRALQEAAQGAVVLGEDDDDDEEGGYSSG